MQNNNCLFVCLSVFGSSKENLPNTLVHQMINVFARTCKVTGIGVMKKLLEIVSTDFFLKEFDTNSCILINFPGCHQALTKPCACDPLSEKSYKVAVEIMMMM